MSAVGFGAFGKMPSVGDFFRLGVSAVFVEAWDEWIQRSMLKVSKDMGDTWDVHYMSAPLWRFCLSPGLIGPNKMLGVLMPSVDRVGRRFPLTLVAPVSNEGSAILTHFRTTETFRRLEDIALASLEDGMTLDTLTERLAGLAVPRRQPTAAIRGNENTIILTRDDVSDCVLPDLAAGMISQKFSIPSIWSTLIGGAPRLMVCEGLPAGANLEGLFNANATFWTEARPV